MKFTEVKADLFTCDKGTSMAHCVSADFHMSAGIATEFKKRFGHVGDLLDQNKTIGEVAVLKDGERYVLYMVTKERYYMKPTMENFEKTVTSLRNTCSENKIRNLAIPRIGCGLDKLDWDTVKECLIKTFDKDDITISVYTL